MSASTFRVESFDKFSAMPYVKGADPKWESEAEFASYEAAKGFVGDRHAMQSRLLKSGAAGFALRGYRITKSKASPR